MSSLIVKVCKIKALEKHSNADTLDIATVEGWNCIVKSGEYQVGDLVVFIPPDSILPESMIEEYKLDFLKNGGRVGTVKLRGVISQGLVLKAPVGFKEGDDVAKFYGITKYEVPEPEYNPASGNRKTAKKGNPYLKKYTDIENIKNYPDVFTEADLVVISEKLHGCLQKTTKLTLADGSKKTIGEIVDNKLDVELLGVNEFGEVVPTKIINWFDNGLADNWLRIKYNRRGFGTQGNYFGSLVCTPEHQIYTERGYVCAKDIRPGDVVSNLKEITKLSYLQESILVGVLLGDGSLYLQNGVASVSFGHMESQKSYVQYTLDSLGDIAGKMQKPQISGYGTVMERARTVSSSGIYNTFRIWKNDAGKKIVPDDIKLNPISLAFWYMDDGNLCHNYKQTDRVMFSTNGFDEHSVDTLVKRLKDNFGIEGVKFNSDGFRIRLNWEEAEKLFLLIAPYVCDSMQYKLPDKYKGRNMRIDEKEISSSHSAVVKQTVLSVEKFPMGKLNKHRYDLETETHNYFANEILVHNCNGRFSNLPININGKYPFFYKIGLYFKKYILGQTHEFVYGSHNMQKFSNSKSYYGDDVWGKIAKKYDLANKIPKDYIVFGEVYGKKIQDLTYGLDDIDLRVFDVMCKGEYLGFEAMHEFCKELDLPIVPILYVGVWYKDVVTEYTSGKSVLYPAQIREGVVIKTYNETNHPKIGRKILKSVSPDYLLRKNGTEFK